MPNVLIRDLPPAVHARLVRRADAAGQSLQQYLVTELTRLASRPAMDEVLARIEGRSGGTVGLRAAVDALRRERPRRMIVVDASVLANAVADDTEVGRRCRRLLAAAQDVAAPDVMDVEVVSVLRRMWLGRGGDGTVGGQPRWPLMA